jgi:hypothetical protein
MMTKIVLFLVLCTLLAGCFEANPSDVAMQTVPVTNNPHAMPGVERAKMSPGTF